VPIESCEQPVVSQAPRRVQFRSHDTGGIVRAVSHDRLPSFYLPTVLLAIGYGTQSRYTLNTNRHLRILPLAWVVCSRPRSEDWPLWTVLSFPDPLLLPAKIPSSVHCCITLWGLLAYDLQWKSTLYKRKWSILYRIGYANVAYTTRRRSSQIAFLIYRSGVVSRKARRHCVGMSYSLTANHAPLKFVSCRSAS